MIDFRNQVWMLDRQVPFWNKVVNTKEFAAFLDEQADELQQFFESEDIYDAQFIIKKYLASKSKKLTFKINYIVVHH